MSDGNRVKSETKPEAETLTAEQKLAVFEFLRSELSSWLKLFGFASLAAVFIAVVGGGYWTLFVLPGRAVESAKDQLQSELAAVSGELTQTLTNQLQESGATRERLENLNQYIQGAEKRILSLSQADEDTLNQAASLATLVQENPELAEISDYLVSGRVVPSDSLAVRVVNSSDSTFEPQHPPTQRSISRDICSLSHVQFYSGRTTTCRLQREGPRNWTLSANRTKEGTVVCEALCFDLRLDRPARPTQRLETDG